MTDAFTDALRDIVLFLPKLGAFLLILIVGLIVAKLIAKAVDAVLERVGFDRAVERGGIKRALAKSRYDASDIVSKLVYYGLVLFVLQLAFGVFGPNPISELLTSVVAFLPLAIVAIVIVVVAAAIASAVRDMISSVLSGLSYGRTLANIAGAFIIGLGVIAALNQVGIATTVTMPVLITVLATIGGILVVGVGGGLIRPMQARWEGYLDTMSRETENIRREVAASDGVDRVNGVSDAGGAERLTAPGAQEPPPSFAPGGTPAHPAHPAHPGQPLPEQPDGVRDPYDGHFADPRRR